MVGRDLRIGGDTVPLADAPAQGEDVIAYARPHQLDIDVDTTSGKGIAARIDRVILSGATARIELTGRIGTNGHAQSQHFEVEVTRQELADLGLAPGQPVRLTSSRLRVFPLQRGE